MCFPTTHWSLLAVATVHGDSAGRDALNTLCGLYRAPVLAYFRAHCRSPEDADDLAQSLFVQLVEVRAWQRADPGRGRFRSYLLGIARNALRQWQRAAHRTKRGSGQQAASIDLLAESGWEPSSPDEEAMLSFDREWARTVLANAWQRLTAASTASPEKRAQFDVLRRFLPGNQFPPSHTEAAAMLGTSQENIRVMIHRLRAGFANALRDEVATTVDSTADIDDEMRHLRAVMTASDDLVTKAAKDFL